MAPLLPAATSASASTATSIAPGEPASALRDSAHPSFTRALARFTPTTLAQMDKVALLNRFDTKYLLSTADLAALLPSLAREYLALDVEGQRAHRYRTLYFDTPDFDLYRRHHQGLAVRHKVRSRIYADTGICYFEVKAKSLKGRTLKYRLPTEGSATELTPEAQALLATHLPPDERLVEPKLWNDFVRITLVGKDRAERLTLDLGVQYDYAGRTAILPGVAICELKQGGSDEGSVFAERMQERGVESISISKYCVGVALLVPGVEQDAYQDKLREIERIAFGA